MKISIIVSNLDKAGLNIKRNLIEHYNFKKISETFQNNDIYYNEKLDVKLHTINCSTIDSENIDKEIETDLFLYATKHESASGKPSFSAHAPGNWDTAGLGGEDDKLCISPQNFVKEALIRLNKNYKEFPEFEDFEIIQECTHHGPYINKPIFFIEIGATEKEWSIPKAGYLLAKTIVSMLENRDEIQAKEYISTVGIGGLHTLPNFKDIIFNSNYAISHECPKYMLENLNKDKIIDAINRSTKKAELIILDWKGMGKYKEQISSEIEKVLENVNIRVEKLKVIKRELKEN